MAYNKNFVNIIINDFIHLLQSSLQIYCDVVSKIDDHALILWYCCVIRFMSWSCVHRFGCTKTDVAFLIIQILREDYVSVAL